jgi:hypothetical protein
LLKRTAASDDFLLDFHKAAARRTTHSLAVDEVLNDLFTSPTAEEFGILSKSCRTN